MTGWVHPGADSSNIVRLDSLLPGLQVQAAWVCIQLDQQGDICHHSLRLQYCKCISITWAHCLLNMVAHISMHGLLDMATIAENQKLALG